MVMLVVVPGKEAPCPGPGRRDGGETVRIIGTVFHGLELRLAEWIVVEGVWTAVAFRDAQIDQQLAQRLGLHQAAVVGVEAELVGLNVG